MDALTAIAGPPTIFRSSPAGTSFAATRLEPTSQSDIAPQFGAASTRLAPAAPALAYSMTGNMEALTDYVQEYQSGPSVFYEPHAPYDTTARASDPAVDDSHEQAPDRPAKKSFLLVGSLAAASAAVSAKAERTKDPYDTLEAWSLEGLLEKREAAHALA